MIIIRLNKTIYEYAVSYGYVSADIVTSVKKYADEKKCPPAKALLETAAMTEDNLLKLQGQIHNYKIIFDIKKIEIDRELVARFDETKLATLKMLPFGNTGRLKVMITEPVNSVIVEDYVREVMGRGVSVEFYLVTETALSKYMNSNSNTVIEYDLDQLHLEGEQDTVIYDITGSDIGAIVKLANQILFKASKMKASDIHIEPHEDKSRLRLRIDGILHTVLELPRQVHNQLINRIKTMADMDINNQRIFQGGGIRVKIHGSYIDIRVSAMPTVYGEKMVMRLLNKEDYSSFNIDMFFFSEENKRKFINCIKKPSGIILITGQTGSGKSTTLYAAISEINNEQRCIVTIEDPVEYRIAGIVQVQVHHEIGRTFPACLREVLRQDPDIILIGEIRDKETATTAMGASNTGHLIFSTLHTNDAVSAIVRLTEMGIEAFMVGSTINGIASQRLVRRICKHCKTEYQLEISSPFRKVLNCGDREVILFRGKGCDECNNTGYSGRIAVQEFLVMDEDLRAAIYANATSAELQRIAVKNGMKTIYEDGIEKSLAGINTLDEVHSILHFDYLE